MRSPACLMLTMIGLLSFVPSSDAARGGGSAPRPVARVSRVTSAPKIAAPIRPAAQSQASFRALRNDVRRDLGANRRQNRNQIIVAWGYPYGYYGSDPAYGLSYTPNDFTASQSDGTSSCPLPGASAAPASVAVNPENGESRDDLLREQARLQADLEASPGWATVNADISTSSAAIAAARQHVDDSLTASPEYQVAQSQKAAAEKLLATVRSSDHPDETRIWSVAENKLQASQAMTRLEQQALALDSSYSDANSRLQSAAAARNAMLESLRARMQNEGR